MFWNLGNWCRSRFNKCPLPEKLQRFEPHIKYEIDRDHEKIGDKPQFNNYFINVVKNLGAHVFNMWIARRKASILTRPYLKRSKSRHASMIIVTLWLLLVREGTDMFDKLLVTKLVKMTHVPDTYHGQYLRFCGEQLWTETPKKRSPPLEQGCPCVVCACVCVSITSDKKIFPSRKEYPLPSWYDRRRRKQSLQLRKPEVVLHMKSACFSFGSAVWFIQPPRRGSRITERHRPLGLNTLCLVPTRTFTFLAKTLRGVKAETYTPELAKKTESVGDCCMKSICEWGHARLAFEEDVNDFDDQDHMDFVGEFFLFSQWSLFILWPQHLHGCPNGHWCAQPASCSFTAFWHEMEGKTCLCSSSQEDSTKGKKEGYSEIEQAQGSRLWWWSFTGRIMEQPGGRPTWAQDSNTGYGDSSALSTRQWRSKKWWAYTSRRRR